MKKRRERDSDTMTRSDKYRSDVTDFDKTSKGTEATKSLYLKKKLWEDEKSKLGANIFTEKVHHFSRPLSIL